MPHKDDQDQTDGLGDTAPFQAIEEGGASDTPGDTDKEHNEESNKEENPQASAVGETTEVHQERS